MKHRNDNGTLLHRAEMNLRPWRAVAQKLEKRDGVKLTPARVMQICQTAETKIATGLRLMGML